MTVACIRSKFGFCKFGNQCKDTHFSETCEKDNCSGNSCDKRHPVACYFYDRFGRCKFSVYCCYKHAKSKEKKQNDEIEKLRNDVFDIKKELKESKTEEKSFICEICDQGYKTEKKLRQHRSKNHEHGTTDLESSRKLQQEQGEEMRKLEDKVKQFETKESLLESRVKNLESYVLRLQEKFESEELNNYNPGTWDPEKTGWAIFDPIVRRKSMELKCDKCDYVGRNSARLEMHKEVKHTIICYLCGDRIFDTEDELSEHKLTVHENLDKVLTEEHFENLSESDYIGLKYGDSPRSKDVVKRYNLRQETLRKKKLKL